MKLVIHALPITPGGGLSVLLGLLGGWRRAGLPLHVTVLNSVPASLDVLAQSKLADRLEPVLVGAGPARTFAWQQVQLARRVLELAPDVVMATNHYVRGLRVPLVVHHQNLYRFVPRGQTGRAFSPVDVLRNRLARLALHRAAANVFISDYLRQSAERDVPMSAGRNHVIYNGISDELLARAAAEPQRWDGSPGLIAVQSAARHKDNPTLLAALVELQRSEPETPWQLRIAGGPGRGSWDAVRQQAEALGVSDRIIFLGHLGPADLEREFRAALCLVFTSVLEAFGLPLIEAMACRCPVIAARGTAIPEVVGSAGLLVEPRSAPQFAAAVLRLHREPALRNELITAGLARAAGFSWQASAEAFYRLFESVAGSN